MIPPRISSLPRTCCRINPMRVGIISTRSRRLCHCSTWSPGARSSSTRLVLRLCWGLCPSTSCHICRLSTRRTRCVIRPCLRVPIIRPGLPIQGCPVHNYVRSWHTAWKVRNHFFVAQHLSLPYSCIHNCGPIRSTTLWISRVLRTKKTWIHAQTFVPCPIGILLLREDKSTVFVCTRLLSINVWQLGPRV